MPLPSSKRCILWRLHLRSSPEEVYELVSSDAGRARFWAESSVEREGVVHLEFTNGMSCDARVVERERPRRWVVDGYFGSRVELTFERSERGGTDLTLRNSGFHEDEFAEQLAGWLNVLLPLKAAADHGIDLRTHDPARTWEQGWADQ